MRTHFAMFNILELELDAVAYNRGSAMHDLHRRLVMLRPEHSSLVFCFLRNSARELEASRPRSEALVRYAVTHPLPNVLIGLCPSCPSVVLPCPGDRDIAYKLATKHPYA